MHAATSWSHKNRRNLQRRRLRRDQGMSRDAERIGAFV
jgi:hypothetical protein